MTQSAWKVIVTIYLRGDRLDPAAVSAALGLQPSRSQLKGERRTTPTGAQYETNIGLWALRAEAYTRDVSAIIDKLTANFGGKHVAFDEIAGVEEVFLKVLVIAETYASDGGTCEFELTEDNVRALRHLGVPVRFAIEMVRP